MPWFAMPQTKDSDTIWQVTYLAKIAEDASPRRHAEISSVKVKDTHLMINKLPPAEILCGECDSVVINASCLSIECQDPLEEKSLRCCHFGRGHQGWLSADYNLRFEYDLFLFSRLIDGIMPRNMPEHVLRQISCCHHRSILSVRWREFWPSCKYALVKYCSAIDTKGGLIRGSVG